MYSEKLEKSLSSLEKAYGARISSKPVSLEVYMMLDSSWSMPPSNYLFLKYNNGYTPLMFALRYNKEKKLNLSSEQFDYLIQNSDLNQVDKDGLSPLIYALKYHKEQNLNLNKEQWKFLIENSNKNLLLTSSEVFDISLIEKFLSKEDTIELKINQLKAIDKKENGEDLSPLLVALRYNKEKNLNLSDEQFDYLIKNSDLKKVDKNGNSALMILLKNDTLLNLKQEQWDYLIKNSDLNQANKEGLTPLMLALKYKDELVECIEKTLKNNNFLKKINSIREKCSTISERPRMSL